mmetsp:Transcript_443/g.548  ORF Transcript_443/g.548 Transcript_443/m.548 type:complete len:94 (-) Transcript_443:509-790(-)
MLSLKTTVLFLIFGLMLHVGGSAASSHRQNYSRQDDHRRWGVTKKQYIPERRTHIDITEIAKLASHSRFVDRLRDGSALGQIMEKPQPSKRPH